MEFESRDSCCHLIDQNSINKTKVDKLLQKLKYLIFSDVEKNEQKGIFERDTVKTCHHNEIPEVTTENYGSIDSLSSLDVKQCSLLIQRLQQTLREVREQQLKCEILVPCGLIKKVAQDIVSMSYCEPCGLRGCTLYINLEEKQQCKRLAKLSYDPNTVDTFELHLTLKEETRRWCFFKKLFISLSGCMKEITWSSSWKLLCSSYGLEKKKLYRKN
ncbi:DNA damage-inducible transcript 4-like protein [Mytilus californianus]|uniref:DNA damage-inducible transcript 4-like protein n=1 Tax=Mytilus californianus TaxID=6549 RepID=UPI002245C8E3|nr:DNA damage-inducible transcript 4-like protein [Mytilus californianus]